MLLKCLPWILGTLLVAPLQAQEQEQPDERPAIETLLETLARAVRKSNREDPTERGVVEVVRDLGAQWMHSGDRDRSAIVRGLDRVFLARRRTDKEGVRITPIYREAAKAIREEVTGKKVKPHDFPDVEDGLIGMAFIEAAVKSASSKEKWTRFPRI